MRLFSQRNSLTVREMTVFALLGAIMFLTKFIMQVFPNIHLLALFIAAFTLTYRVRALIPLYVYVFLDGLFAGFSMWWLPYTYIWLPLWGVVMLVSRIPMTRRVEVPVYMIICGLSGLVFGTLYAPAQALMFGLSFQGMVAWIISGLPFDLIHGISNFFAASMVIPLHTLLQKLDAAKRSFG